MGARIYCFYAKTSSLLLLGMSQITKYLADLLQSNRFSQHQALQLGLLSVSRSLYLSSAQYSPPGIVLYVGIYPIGTNLGFSVGWRRKILTKRRDVLTHYVTNRNNLI